MLEVPIDKILPVTEARDHLNKLVDELPEAQMYVLTKGGKPGAILISVDKLKELTGEEVTPPATPTHDIQPAPDQPKNIEVPESPHNIQSQTPLTPPERYEAPEPPADISSQPQSWPGGPVV